MTEVEKWNLILKRWIKNGNEWKAKGRHLILIGSEYALTKKAHCFLVFRWQESDKHFRKRILAKIRRNTNHE